MNCCHNHNPNIEDEKIEGETVYTCPMHPEIQEEKPGMCGECGMALVKSAKFEARNPKKEKTQHSKVYSQLFEKAFRFSMPAFSGSEYLSFILGSIVFFYGGMVFLKSAKYEIQGKAPGMMTLISLAITTAYIYSTFAVFAGQQHTLFWELTTLITIMLLGHWIEMRAVQSAQGALRELAKLLPDSAEVVRGEKVEKISLDELKVGDIVFVRPGTKVPADGIVSEGLSEIDESMISGESKPVDKKVGDTVVAGSINGDGSLKVKVTEIGEHTFLSGIMRLVKEAQASKSKIQLLSDRAAFYLTIVAVIAGGGSFIWWFMAGKGVAFAVERLVAVLVIACPHALGLAIPLVASISTTLAARNGLLIKRRLALEAARNINIVLFDKTGTLTEGKFGITDVLVNDDITISEKEIIQIAASADAGSEHPIARAIVEGAHHRGIALLPVESFARMPGKGVRVLIEGKTVVVGSASAIQEFNISIPSALQEKTKLQEATGKTVVYVLSNNILLGAIALSDIIRSESKATVEKLHALGIKVAMITGDAEDVAKSVSEELHIDEYFARVLPDQKSEKVKALQERGLKVAFVGDGINDAPALTQADVGIAIGAGTTVAIESAGIILIKSNPLDVVKVFSLSKYTYRKMIQNLWWAAGYNIIAIPAAAGVFAGYGMIMQPAVGAVLMSASTVIVAFNAWLMRKAVL
ncbi:MAG: Cation transporting ATPase, E1-E2 family [Parcubacteria group bacterium GW2011_GWC1_41_7]|nr:MAG: Cation transporting ATPase, E1-E2 family [Parcubacteria group bacterium GW2011_GWC1_41_7]